MKNMKLKARNLWSVAVCALAASLAASCTTAPKQAADAAGDIATDSLEIVMSLHKKIKPECVGAYKAAFAKCKAATVQEEGCLDYGYYQSPEDSTEFLIYENWANEAALARHGQTAHLKELQETTKEMIESQSVKKVYALPQR